RGDGVDQEPADARGAGADRRGVRGCDVCGNVRGGAPLRAGPGGPGHSSCTVTYRERFPIRNAKMTPVVSSERDRRHVGADRSRIEWRFPRTGDAEGVPPLTRRATRLSSTGVARSVFVAVTAVAVAVVVDDVDPCIHAVNEVAAHVADDEVSSRHRKAEGVSAF